MCGIFCWVAQNRTSQEADKVCDEIKRSILRLVRRRGPDGCGTTVELIHLRDHVTKQGPDNVAEQRVIPTLSLPPAAVIDELECCGDVVASKCEDASDVLKQGAIDGISRIDTCTRIEAVASILHLRGKFTPQPLKDKMGNVLIWNGEIFGGVEVGEGDNDTRILLDMLSKCSDFADIPGAMSHLHGPWAFVYYQVKHQLLWFGRDFFGRRSLLWHLPHHRSDSFALSSVATRTGKQTDWIEVPTGIYHLNLSLFMSGETHITYYGWSCGHSAVVSSELEKLFAMLPVECQQYTLCAQSPDLLSPPVTPFNSSLTAVTITPHIGVHVDSSIVCSRYKDSSLDSILRRQLADTFLSLLEAAVMKRVMNIPPLSDEMSLGRPELESECAAGDAARQTDCHRLTLGNAKVGVLFSGGVDSIVLAALADRFLAKEDEIDLLNVAFEQRVHRSGQCAGKKKPLGSEDSCAVESSFDVPDRLTGLSGLQELRGLSRDRKWNFVQVDVAADELQRERDKHIGDLVYPHTTVLDDSIGCALWFAARGQGTLNCPESVEKLFYQSRAKVLLVGMGADEQLGGYSRHREAFRLRMWQGLLDEIQLDVGRISQRNLGRDDRCISDHGRESRLPYLDEDVASFLNSLPVWCKADPRLPRGEGEKIILRDVARLLGLVGSANCPKRAIQFGSRVAKLQGSRNKGSDTSSYLLHNVAMASHNEQLQETYSDTEK